MSFRGIPAGNDARYTNAEKKLLQTTKFPAIFATKIDTSKVNLQVLGNWIGGRVTELLGFEDEVVIELVKSMLEAERFPDPRKCQITLTGFLETNTPAFMKELWELLISAQREMGGIPAALLEAKKAEIQRRRVEESQIQGDIEGRRDHHAMPERRSGANHDHTLPIGMPYDTRAGYGQRREEEGRRNSPRSRSPPPPPSSSRRDHARSLDRSAERRGRRPSSRLRHEAHAPTTLLEHRSSRKRTTPRSSSRSRSRSGSRRRRRHHRSRRSRHVSRDHPTHRSRKSPSRTQHRSRSREERSSRSRHRRHHHHHRHHDNDNDNDDPSERRGRRHSRPRDRSRSRSSRPGRDKETPVLAADTTNVDAKQREIALKAKVLRQKLLAEADMTTAS